jgi:beta-lactamase superfamily II metal-dependent hydrolase
MRASDPGEFWQFRTFWASQNLAKRPGTVRPLLPEVPSTEPPAGVRWFIDQSRQIQADQMLGLLRDLDDVMNNTSVILLLEVGKQKILLPGDARVENWSYALSKPEWRKRLADVNLYEVGHHGSRNATPKRLWHLLKQNSRFPSSEEAEDSFCTELTIHF